MKPASQSRRDVLKAAGYVMVTFTIPSAAAPAMAAERRRGGGGPDLNGWLKINADGTVTVFTGKMELGQGIRTAVAQIAAEELDVEIERIRVVMADTALTPNEGYTVASMSIETSGMAIRSAAAEARHILVQLASKQLGIPADELRVVDGTIFRAQGEKSATYWALAGGQKLQRASTGNARTKRPEDHRIVGKPATRLEMLDIVTGRPMYVHDMQLPGMLHARVIRPPSYSATLKSIDDGPVAQMEGVVKIHRDGNYIAVIAQREEQAVFAADELQKRCAWEEPENLPPMKELYSTLRASAAANRQVVREAGNVEKAFTGAAKRIEAKYTRPYQMHASIGPSCAVAHLQTDKLTVWSHTQGPYPLRQSLANLVGMPPEKVRVIGSFGAGCYGHNGADDVAADAALLARVVSGRPVRVQWSRNDEHTWEPYGSAMMIDLAGALDSVGNIIAYDAQLWSDTQSTRPGGDPFALMPAWHLAEPRKMRRGGGFIGGASRNSEPLYDIANQRIIGHSFAGPLRVSALRGLGAYANVFAMECFMDELAHVAGADPVEFRLRHLKNPRATAVTEAAAKAFGWKDLRVANRGKGIAFSQYKNHATYCAVCVEVEVNPADGVVCLLRMVAAADAGQVINPDGLRNQIEGGMIQSASWTLREQVTFNRRGITSFDWHSYPIIDFSEAPSTQVIVLDRPDQPPLGAGEAAQGPTGAAIANAIFSATGRRVRDLPITPQKITRAEPANA